jgi:hypothetical protein
MKTANRFWEHYTCDGLFLLFDTSAHINNGTPDVSASEVQDHIEDCDDCQGQGVSVSPQEDGSYFVNGA